MIIRAVIIEDETLAIQRLKRFLNEMEDSFEIVAELSSVQEALSWFVNNPATPYDLIFSDIQLLDGISFEIFEKTELKAPVIFITAFDEYLMKAFKTFSIDYLLKPFLREELENAISKFKQFFKQPNVQATTENIYARLLQNLQSQNNFPSFLTHHKDKIIIVKSEEIACFSLDYQAVFAHVGNDKWLLSESLNQLQEKLPAKHFYRANRQFIVQRKFIKEIDNYFNNRLRLVLSVRHPEILISKDNAKAFKDWLQE